MSTAADRTSHEQAFSRLVAARAWGDGESACGAGSGLERTASVRDALRELCGELGVRTLLDAGCGDCHWISAADLPLRRYVGVDVVDELLAAARARYAKGRRRRILRADITTDPLPRADLVLCRECLMHFPDEDVHAALRNFAASGSTWLLTTSWRDGRNEAIEVGGWRRLDLEAAPFGLPAPVAEIPDGPLDGSEPGKRLGLWSLGSHIPAGATRTIGR